MDFSVTSCGASMASVENLDRLAGGVVIPKAPKEKDKEEWVSPHLQLLRNDARLFKSNCKQLNY